MRRVPVTITVLVDLDGVETVETKEVGEETHVIAKCGPYRNLVARVLKLDPAQPLGRVGLSSSWPVSRMAQRSRELCWELENAPALEPPKKRRAKAA